MRPVLRLIRKPQTPLLLPFPLPTALCKPEADLQKRTANEDRLSELFGRSAELAESLDDARALISQPYKAGGGSEAAERFKSLVVRYCMSAS